MENKLGIKCFFDIMTVGTYINLKCQCIIPAVLLAASQVVQLSVTQMALSTSLHIPYLPQSAGSEKDKQLISR
jgi:hypothetical protein